MKNKGRVYDNQSQLLYEFEYSFKYVFHRYLFSSDGTHFVRLINISPDADIHHLESSTALMFFSYGQLVKQYFIGEFVSGDEIVGSPSGVVWMDLDQDPIHDMVNDILHIETVNDQYISFDLYNGDILHQSDTSPFSEVHVGSQVVIVSTVYHSSGFSNEYTDIPNWVRAKPHTVVQLEKNRVLLGGKDGINSWVGITGVIPYIPMRE